MISQKGDLSVCNQYLGQERRRRGSEAIEIRAERKRIKKDRKIERLSDLVKKRLGGYKMR